MDQKIKQKLIDFHNEFYNLISSFGYRYDLNVYDETFFGFNQTEGLRMAPWFIPLLQKTFNFKSLADIGCGTGHYLYYSLDHGIKNVFGIEGSSSAFKLLLVDKKYVTMHDLRNPYKVVKKMDLVISIEVAEHIDKLYVKNYIEILTDISDTVVLTAAHPGQGGEHHVNEQSQGWWKNQFREKDYFFDLKSTKLLQNGMAKEKDSGSFITTWFKPNIMVFRKTA